MLTTGKRFLVKTKKRKKMNNIKLYWSIISEYLYLGALAIIIFLATGLFLSIPLWLLWNWLMPYIFGLPTLSLFQTFGLTILVTLISPKEINWNPTKKVPKKDDIEVKLEKVLQDITSQFKA